MWVCIHYSNLDILSNILSYCCVERKRKKKRKKKTGKNKKIYMDLTIYVLKLHKYTISQ